MKRRSVARCNTPPSFVMEKMISIAYDVTHMKDFTEHFKGKKITVMGHRSARKPLGFPTFVHASLTAFRHREPHGSPTPSLKPSHVNW